MKTKEELTALRNEVKTLNAKLAELTEDELKEVVGGTADTTFETVFTPEKGPGQYEFHVYTMTGENDGKPNFGK
ncbi:MAG: hypothetical protein MJ088_05880 [Clostridia bacterium]|nr:hypothetical protein [Clostridia bacterium]